MATINPVIDRLTASPDESVVICTWDGLAISGDVGAPINFSAWSSKTFVVSGTFTGAPTILIEGSNDGITWVSLSNRQGTAMSFTAASMNTSQDRPVFVRPRLSAGSGGAAVKVAVACHREDLPGKGW